MVFIINNKKYDTKKMEKIADVKKWYESTSVMFKGLGHTRECELWRSGKGNWLLTYEGAYGYRHGQAIGEEEARQLLLEFDIGKYEALFGEIEEA